MARPFVIIDCLHGFACNPCAFARPHGAISKSSTSTMPSIDFDRCTGCMDCVYQCPGLAGPAGDCLVRIDMVFCMLQGYKTVWL